MLSTLWDHKTQFFISYLSPGEVWWWQTSSWTTGKRLGQAEDEREYCQRQQFLALLWSAHLTDVSYILKGILQVPTIPQRQGNINVNNTGDRHSRNTHPTWRDETNANYAERQVGNDTVVRRSAGWVLVSCTPQFLQLPGIPKHKSISAHEERKYFNSF